MKNVYIIDDYASSKNNGIGTYIKELIICLKEIGMNISQISFYHDTKTFKIEMDNGIKQMQFPVIPDIFVKHYTVLDKFFRLYIEDSPDNVFFFNLAPYELFVKTVKSSFPLSKIVFVLHDMIWTTPLLGDKAKIIKYAIEENVGVFEKEYPDLLPNFNEEKRMFEIVHRIIALAPETVELLHNVYNICNQKISFIPNGLEDTYHYLSEIDRIKLKEKLLIPLFEKIILFAGRVSYVKGIYQIINSLKKIVKTYPNFRLIVVGTIYETKKIMEYACDIASKITFTGQIPKDRLNEWYQVADIGVIASYWEQCSYTGIEMMMHGLPVVASDGFCVGDMFKEGVNAKVAQISNRNRPEEFENNLSKAFLELLQSPNLRRSLGEIGRKIYESNYHINKMKEGYRMLFDSL